MKTVLDATPLSGTLKEFQPLDIRIVNQTEYEPTWDLMVRHYHYLGYDKMIGPRIKYLVFQKGVPIAALSYNRAALRIGVRDRFIRLERRTETKVFVSCGKQQPFFNFTMGQN